MSENTNQATQGVMTMHNNNGCVCTCSDPEHNLPTFAKDATICEHCGKTKYEPIESKYEPIEGIDVTVNVRNGPLQNGNPVIDGLRITFPTNLAHIERGPEWSEVTLSLDVADELIKEIYQCMYNVSILGKLDYIIKSAPHGTKRR